MRPLRQSTATQVVTIGPFVDDTDYVTAETALTIANTDIKLTKGGATSQVNKNSGGATHLANGVYYLTLDATDTNTLGALEIQVKVAGALLVREVFYVVAGAWRDAMHATGAGVVADVWTWRGGSVATPNVTGVPKVDVTHLSGTAEDVALGSEITALNDPTAAAIADAVWDELQSAHVTAGSFGEIATEIADILTDTGTTLDAALAVVDANVDAILDDTGTSGVIVATNNDKTGYTASTVSDKTGYSLSSAGIDAILDEPIVEPTASDITWASMTFRKALQWTVAIIRNKGTLNRSTGAWALRNDADAADLLTATDSDDGTTYTKGERG